MKNGINKHGDSLYSLTKVILKFKDIGLNMYEEVRKNPSKVAILSKCQNTSRKRCFGAVLLFKVRED